MDNALFFQSVTSPGNHIAEIALRMGLTGLFLWGVSLTLIPVFRALIWTAGKRKVQVKSLCESIVDGIASNDKKRINKSIARHHFIPLAKAWFFHYQQHTDQDSRNKLIAFALESGLVRIATHVLQRQQNAAMLISALRILDRIDTEDLTRWAIPLLQSHDRHIKFEIAKYLIHKQEGRLLAPVMLSAVSRPRLSAAQIGALLEDVDQAHMDQGFWDCMANASGEDQENLITYLPYLSRSAAAFPLNLFVPVNHREKWISSAIEHVEDAALTVTISEYATHPSERIRSVADLALCRLQHTDPGHSAANDHWGPTPLFSAFRVQPV